MPAAAVAAGGGIISAGVSIFGAISAGKRAKELQKQIDEYQRQELVNPYEGLQVSTLGADRQREDLARTMATYGNLASMGGSRAIGMLAPQLIQQQNQQEAQIMANLDEQEKQRQQLIAQGNGMVQGMVEQRENNDLLGLGNSLNVANQERANNINQLATTAMSTGMAAAGGLGKGNPTGGGGGGGLSASLPDISPIAGTFNPQLISQNIPQNISTKNNGVVNSWWTGLMNPSLNF